MNVRSVLVATATGARLVAASSGTVAFMVLIHIVIVSTMGSLWRTAAEANGGSVAGYDASALIWYIVATEAAVSGVMGRLIELVGDDIASGAVAAEMLRPAPVVGVRLATELGRTLARISIAFVVGALVALALGAGGPSPAGLALAVPALVLAGLTNVAAQHGFAAIAFWVRDVRSTWFLYQKLVFILGGMLIPLEVLPEGLGHLALGQVEGPHDAGRGVPERSEAQLRVLMGIHRVARYPPHPPHPPATTGTPVAVGRAAGPRACVDSARLARAARRP
jgi:ABC-2 type transport system permease protein